MRRVPGTAPASARSRRSGRLDVGPLTRRLPLILLPGLLPGCGTAPVRTMEEAVLDPVGTYDLSMSSVTRVSGGTLEIRGEPGNYRGTFSVGVLSAAIAGVEAGAGILNVHANLPQGSLVLRLTGDGRCFAGNWVLGVQRGTVTAEKLPRPRGSGGCQHFVLAHGLRPARGMEEGGRQPTRRGGPVATGRSSRLPHSAQDPS